MAIAGHLPADSKCYLMHRTHQSPHLSFPEWGPWWDGKKGRRWCTLPPRLSTSEVPLAASTPGRECRSPLGSSYRGKPWGLLVLEMLLLRLYPRSKQRFKNIWQMTIMKLSLILKPKLCIHFFSLLYSSFILSPNFFDVSWISEGLLRTIKGKYVRFHRIIFVQSKWKS